MRLGLCALASVLLASCTSAATYGASAASYRETQVSANVGSLAGSQIYIYSFLDFWSFELGPEMLREFERQLGERLAERGIETSVVTWGAPGTKLQSVDAGSNDYVLRSRTALPVQEVITANRESEVAYGSDYRLMILPVQMSGSGGRYEAQMLLVDIATDEVVWRTELEGSFTPFASRNEGAERRANVFVEGAIQQMAASGLF